MRNSDHQSDHIYYTCASFGFHLWVSTYFYEYYTNRTWCLWFANDSKCVCCVQSFLLSSKSGSPSCIECSIVQASKLLGVDTIPMTHVQHKTIHKRSSQKKEFIVLIFVKFVETKHPTCWKLFIVPTIV
jgi:hypothetical protein